MTCVFGYNQVEGPKQYLTGLQLARHLTDIVSRGGHFPSNIGPRADGTSGLRPLPSQDGLVTTEKPGPGPGDGKITSGDGGS